MARGVSFDAVDQVGLKRCGNIELRVEKVVVAIDLTVATRNLHHARAGKDPDAGECDDRRRTELVHQRQGLVDGLRRLAGAAENEAVSELDAVLVTELARPA